MPSHFPSSHSNHAFFKAFKQLEAKDIYISSTEIWSIFNPISNKCFIRRSGERKLASKKSFLLLLPPLLKTSSSSSPTSSAMTDDGSIPNPDNRGCSWAWGRPPAGVAVVLPPTRVWPFSTSDWKAGNLFSKFEEKGRKKLKSFPSRRRKGVKKNFPWTD